MKTKSLFTLLFIFAIITSSFADTPTPTPTPIKISQMPSATSLGDTDVFPIVQSGTNKKVAWSVIFDSLISNAAFSSGWSGSTDVSPTQGAVYDAIHAFNTSDDGSIISASTGFRINGAAASGKILRGDGTNLVLSTPTYPNTATSAAVLIGDGTNIVLSTPTWPTVAGTAGYKVRSDGTNFASYPTGVISSSTSDNTGFASDTYIAGSAVTVAAGDFKAGGQYRCVFDMVKTGAGTAAATIDVRIGTAGTTSDSSRITFTFGAGTANADSGTFEVIVTFRTVGSGTSAVVSGICRAQHNLATTGLFNNAAAWTIIGTTSSGFASNTATKIGLSFNGGTSFAGTNQVVQAVLNQ